MSRLNVLLTRTVRALLWAGAAAAFLRWLLVPLLPFLLALGLSALAEPAVVRLARGLRVRRSLASGIVTTALLAVPGTAAVLLAGPLVSQLRDWTGRLPEALGDLPALWNGLLDRADGWYESAPAFLRTALDALARELTENGPSLAGLLGRRLMELGSSLVSALPDAGLFLVTAVLAAYFTGARYPEVLAFLKRQLPEARRRRCRDVLLCLRAAAARWLRSQLLLILMTFALLWTGFIWLRVPCALLAAFFTALVDALPVLGTGTVLLPWALGCLLLGQGKRAAGLAALYAVCSLTRSLLEPRLLAGQGGLPPLGALAAMYAGFRLMGVGGMLLFPLVLLLLKQLQDAGVVQIWK